MYICQVVVMAHLAIKSSLLECFLAKLSAQV